MSKNDKNPKNDPSHLDAAGDAFRSAAKKGVNFFKKAKAALKGDEAAKEELSEAASAAMVRAQDKVEQAGKALGDLADKVEKKIEEKRKPSPPNP